MANKSTLDLSITSVGDLDQVLLKIHRYAKALEVERNNLQYLKAEAAALKAERDAMAERLAELDPLFDSAAFAAEMARKSS